MDTLNYINDLLEEYIQAISSIDSETESEYNYRYKSTKEHFVELFDAMRNAHPEMLQYNYTDDMPEDELDRIVNRINQNAASHFSAPILPFENVALDKVNEDIFVTPTFLPWQMEGNRKQNFVISFNNNMWAEAQNMQSNLLQNMLLQFAPGCIRFNIFDFGMTGMSDSITLHYDSEIYNGKVIMEDREAAECIRRLRDRMQTVMQKYGDYARYCERVKKIEIPYEVVVLNNYPEGFSRYNNLLQPLFENGHRGGIYFVVMHNTSLKALESHVPDLLFSENKTVLPFQKEYDEKGTIVNSTPFSHISSLVDVYRRNFHEITHGPEAEVVQKMDFAEVSTTAYQKTNSMIYSPIGSTEEGEVVEYKMDVNKGHYHAFVIGETGSGKSRFLHNIIISMISKYSPEDLELYLMDFKGVEFNCYRDIKHSRVVLVDRADERITYEVINELKEKMEERQRVLASADASDVDEYNKKMTDKHLSQIILIADECQTLFGDRTRNSRLQNEMIDVIALVAQQGRAYGVHLLLATQSLANAPQLGKDILNQIGEHFILPCLPADARRLVPDHEQSDTEKVVSKMEKGKGQCYYQGTDGKYLFTFNFIEKGEEQSRLVDMAKNKAANYSSNGQVYFSGSLQFAMTSDILSQVATKGKQNMIVTPGQAINLSQAPLSIILRNEVSENIMLMGINDKHFVTRTALNILTSSIAISKKKGLLCDFIVIDCYQDEDAEYAEVLDAIADEGLCTLVNKKDRISTLYNICKDIAEGRTSRQKMLFFLGEENFRELKHNMPIEQKEPDSQDPLINSNMSYEDALFMMNSIENKVSKQTPTEDISQINSVTAAVSFILSKGPEHGVHSVVQLDKVDNFHIDNDGYINVKKVYERFRHIIILRSNEKDIPVLRLPDDIRPDRLEDNADRLRAYYYNEGNNKFSLFTPYIQMKGEQNINLINEE